MVIEHFLPLKETVCIVVGLMPRFLKFNKCCCDSDEKGIKRSILECKSKFARRLFTGQGFANFPHIGVTKGPGDALAKGVSISPGNQHARGFVDQEVKKCIVGR
ncbi:MAG: hypothetical protein OXC26_02980 [Albidovulum sp.]|nr:hypothetical protein [Albidovulum sp.]